MSLITDTAHLERLLPCPFCGGKEFEMWLDDDDGEVTIECHSYTCFVKMGGDGIEDAIRRWNQRSPLTAVKIYRNARGEWQTHAVSLNYSRPARLEDALERVRRGRTVFVQPEDADVVLEAAKGAGDSGEAA